MALSNKFFILIFVYDLVFHNVIDLVLDLVLVIEIVPDSVLGSSTITCFSMWPLHCSIYN